MATYFDGGCDAAVMSLLLSIIVSDSPSISGYAVYCIQRSGNMFAGQTEHDSKGTQTLYWYGHFK